MQNSLLFLERERLECSEGERVVVSEREEMDGCMCVLMFSDVGLVQGEHGAQIMQGEAMHLCLMCRSLPTFLLYPFYNIATYIYISIFLNEGSIYVSILAYKEPIL